MPTCQYLCLCASTLALALAAASCDKTPEPEPATAQSASTATPAPPPPAAEDKPLPPPAPALLDPSKATQKAPEKFKVQFETTKGSFAVEVTRAWAPGGADRFYNLVKLGFFDDVAFFRVVKGFVVQFGIHGHPQVSAAWHDANIPDEPVKESNLRGYLTYAKGGPNSRTTQLFINFKDNSKLDKMGFPPFGKVVEGMDVVDSLYNEYGEDPSQEQQVIQEKGNQFLRKAFPKLDYIKTARLAG